MKKTITVLIETLWNVKIIFMLLYCFWYIRINRNIVECKVIFCIYNTDFFGIVLIETLWNVKFLPLNPLATRISVLIETLWNVKHGSE